MNSAIMTVAGTALLVGAWLMAQWVHLFYWIL